MKPLPIIVFFISTLLVKGCSPSIEGGRIEYNHSLVVNYESYHQETQVTGTIHFHSSTSGYVDPGYCYQGSGTVSVAISGTADDCTFNGSGTNSVSLKGYEVNHQILFTFEEQWYQPCSLTFTCPDGTHTESLPRDIVSYQLTFPVEDGYTIEQPFSGEEGSGSASWTLRFDSLS